MCGILRRDESILSVLRGLAAAEVTVSASQRKRPADPVISATSSGIPIGGLPRQVGSL